MNSSIPDWQESRIEVCQRIRVGYFTCTLESKVGISAATRSGNFPINGSRHPPKGGTNGWYLWSGIEFSEAEDFFQPIHEVHLIRLCPEIVKYLGLPPGYRFLFAAEGYEDIWFDETLLNLS